MLLWLGLDREEAVIYAEFSPSNKAKIMEYLRACPNLMQGELLVKKVGHTPNAAPSPPPKRNNKIFGNDDDDDELATALANIKLTSSEPNSDGLDVLLSENGPCFYLVELGSTKLALPPTRVDNSDPIRCVEVYCTRYQTQTWRIIDN